MKPALVLGSGLAGALSVTAFHETIRRLYPKAPRLDLLGMQSLSGLFRKAEQADPSEKKLFKVALAADVLSNAIFYTLTGIGKPSYVFLRGAVLGLAAGAGAVMLPKYLGLHEGYSHYATSTKAATVGLYLAGGIITAACMHVFREKKKEDRSQARLCKAAASMIGFDEE